MKLFIWDFHGTLEQGNENTTIEISNSILNNFGYKERLTASQCSKLYGKKWFEFFKYLLPNEPLSRHLELQKACFSYSTLHPEIIVKYIKPTDYAIEVLDIIKRKHDQILVSNTKPESLDIFMDSVGISHFFPAGKAFASDSHTNNSSKYSIIKKFLENNTFDEIYTIGDSPEDVELGKKVDAITFLYSHPGQKYKNCEPHYKIRDLREILKVI